ncbi:hypothetical protein EMIT0158MI4_30601 [Burkholderia ambifaria]
MQPVDHEVRVVVEVARPHRQHVVRAARHDLRGDHFRPRLDRLHEPVVPLGHVRPHRHMHERLECDADLLRLDRAAIPRNGAAFLEQLHAPQARRRRQRDRVREVLIADASVPLEVPEDPHVGSIQSHFAESREF